MGRAIGKRFLLDEPGKLLVSFNDPKDEIDDRSVAVASLRSAASALAMFGIDGFAEIMGEQPSSTTAGIGFFWNVNNVLGRDARDGDTRSGIAHSCRASRATSIKQNNRPRCFGLPISTEGQFATDMIESFDCCAYGAGPAATPRRLHPAPAPTEPAPTPAVAAKVADRRA